MHNNLLPHDIQEMRNENWSTTRKVAITFMKEQMRILPEQVDSMMIGYTKSVRSKKTKTCAIAMKLLLS